MRLNRILADCKKNSDGGDNHGPLENKLSNIKKQTKDLEDEIT